MRDVPSREPVVVARHEHHPHARARFAPVGAADEVLVDARAGVTLANGVSFTAFAANLFDETYNAEFSPGGFVFRARPRRFGFEVGYKF